MSEPAGKVGVGVGIFIFKDHKFLMGRRLGKHGHDTWAVPGGKLEFGESFEQTAKREAKEETGLDITNVRFGAVTNDLHQNENKHYITVWVLSDYLSGKETITEPDKFVDFKWLDFDSLPSPLFLPWQELLESEFVEEIKRQLAG